MESVLQLYTLISQKKYKLPNECSINTAEAIAILTTIEYIKEFNNTDVNIIILSDSLSTPRSLETQQILQKKKKAKIIQEKT